MMNVVKNDNDNFVNNIDDYHIAGGPGLEGGFFSDYNEYCDKRQRQFWQQY